MLGATSYSLHPSFWELGLTSHAISPISGSLPNFRHSVSTRLIASLGVQLQGRNLSCLKSPIASPYSESRSCSVLSTSSLIF
jgi:hypothetical protein